MRSSATVIGAHGIVGGIGQGPSEVSTFPGKLRSSDITKIRSAVKVVINAGYFESLVDKWNIFVDLLAVGFSTALIVVVIVAAVKLGSRHWPWILLAGGTAYLLN